MESGVDMADAEKRVGGPVGDAGMMRTEKLKDGSVTHCHSDTIVDAAEVDLLDYLATHGEQRPGELEDRFCGRPTSSEILRDMLGRWRGSPYYPALARLVDRGVVSYRRDETGDIWYGITAVKIRGSKDDKSSI